MRQRDRWMDDPAAVGGVPSGVLPGATAERRRAAPALILEVVLVVVALTAWALMSPAPIPRGGGVAVANADR